MTTIAATKKEIHLFIASEFSKTPGPRYRTEGEFPGEDFREKILFPKFQEAISTNSVLVVILDGAEGYGTSFLEESFGGLIRTDGISLSDIKSHLKIISEEEPYLIDDIEEYLTDASEN